MTNTQPLTSENSNSKVRFQLVINGSNDRNHGRVFGVFDTREEAEKAMASLQAETRNANPGNSAFLDLRIDTVDEGVPSVAPLMTKEQARNVLTENVSFWVLEARRLGEEFRPFRSMDEFGEEIPTLRKAFETLSLHETHGINAMNAMAQDMRGEGQ